MLILQNSLEAVNNHDRQKQKQLPKRRLYNMYA